MGDCADEATHQRRRSSSLYIHSEALRSTLACAPSSSSMACASPLEVKPGASELACCALPATASDEQQAPTGFAADAADEDDEQQTPAGWSIKLLRAQAPIAEHHLSDETDQEVGSDSRRATQLGGARRASQPGGDPTFWGSTFVSEGGSISRRGSAALLNLPAGAAGLCHLQSSEEAQSHIVEAPSFATQKKRIESALKEMRVAICNRWETVPQAESELSSNNVIDLQRILDELQDFAFGQDISSTRFCVLWQCLGAHCCEESMRITSEEFNRIAEHRTWYQRNLDSEKHESVFNALQVRDALLTSIVGSEKLIRLVQIASTHFIETVDDSASPTDAETEEALASALRACCQAFQTPAREEFVAALMAPSGLRVLMDVMALANIPMECRILAATIVSDGVACRGGPAYKSKFRQVEQAELLRTIEDIQAPADFSAFLATEVWRPILNIIDPDSRGPPHPLDLDLVSHLFALLRQAKVATTAIGQRGPLLVAEICRILQQVHSAQISAEKSAAVNAFELVEKVHERSLSKLGNATADEVHTLAAAFGGCRLLREQMAKLPRGSYWLREQLLPGGKDSTFAVRGDRLLRLWRAARKKLFQRQPALHQEPGECVKFTALKHSIVETHAAGFRKVALNGADEMTPGILKRSPVAQQPAPAGIDIDTLFEVGSTEWELTLRLQNRWDAEQAREKLATEVYDWSWPESLPLAEAMRASSTYIGRGGPVIPPLVIPPRSARSGTRSARVGTALASLKMDGSGRMSTIGSARRELQSLSARAGPMVELRECCLRVLSAGGSPGCSRMPWVVEDGEKLLPFAPVTETKRPAIRQISSAPTKQGALHPRRALVPLPLGLKDRRMTR